jgi:integrase
MYQLKGHCATVNLDTGVVHVRQQLQAVKGRLLPQPRKMAKSTDAPLPPRNVPRMLFDRAPISPRRVHDLRHSAASLLIASGVVVDVSMLIWHCRAAHDPDPCTRLQQQKGF